MMSFLSVIVHVPQHDAISPIDEYVYIDYLAKVPSQLLVYQGEETGDYARRLLACRGVESLGDYPPELCSAAGIQQDERFPNGGLTSADLYTPLYFVTTWVLAQPLQWVGVDDLATAGRFTGGVWLALAGVLLFFALRELRQSQPVSFGLSAILIGSVPAFWSNTYISTDATALAFGALLVLLGARVLHGRSPGWLLVAMSVIAALFKLQHLAPIGAVALWILIQVIRRHSGSDRAGNRLVRLAKDRTLATAVLMVLLPMLAQGAWTVIRSRIAVGPFPDQDVSATLSSEHLLRESLGMLEGASLGALDPYSFGAAAVVLSTLLGWLSVVGVLGSLIVLRKSESWDLAAAVAFLAAVLGPVLAVTNVIVSGFYFVLPARYAMSLLPAMIVCVGFLVAQRPTAKWLWPAIGALAWLLSLTIG